MKRLLVPKTWFALLLCVGMVECVVEPLPSPIAPDPTKIVLSSLVSDSDDTQEGAVAILGLMDAVAGYGTVQIVNSTNDRVDFIQSTVEGSFVGTLLARSGDVLAVSYVVEEFESRVIEIAVPQYESEKDTRGVSINQEAPRQPDDEFDEAVEDPTPQAGGNGPPPPDNGRVIEPGESLFELLGDGLVRVQSGPDFIGAQHTLFVGNLVTGETYSTLAEEDGSVDITFPAEPGDRILMFSASSDEDAQTSPVTEYQIPSE